VLRDHLRQLADQMLAELGRHSLPAEVAQLLRPPPRWGEERIAEQLQLSRRHLHRRRADDGLTFKALRDGERQAMACQLPGRDLRLSQIAEQLGFSDENAFTRAFRRWQGVTPARYREPRR